MSPIVRIHAIDHPSRVDRRPLLFVTEGVLDISCLSAFSRVLHKTDDDIPNLHELASRGELIFLPAGGGDLRAWATRLAPLGCPEFFLCDREQQPETSLRQLLVDQINRRVGCGAALTQKRSLENYLHPTAISATFGVTIEVTDDCPVAELIVRSQFAAPHQWNTLSRHQQRRLIYRVKRRLNSEAVLRMTPELLIERDPSEEILGWFRTITKLLRGFPTAT